MINLKSLLGGERPKTPPSVHPEAARETPFSRAARNNRILTVALATAAITIAAQSAVIISLFPRVKIQPVFVAFDSDTARTVTLMPSQVTELDRVAYARSQAVDYIRNRESISPNQNTNQNRINLVRLFSDDQEFAAYRRWAFETNPFEEAATRNYSRRVVLQSVRHEIRRAVPEVTVDYVLVDTDGTSGEEIKRQCRTADITYTYLVGDESPDRTEREILDNPLGFTVVGYVSVLRESDDEECQL